MAPCTIEGLENTEECLGIPSERKNPQAEVHLSDWLLLVVFPTIIYMSLIVAGIGFLSGKSWAVAMLAASCIALLLVAARGAWNTLVTIAEYVQGAMTLLHSKRQKLLDLRPYSYHL